MLKREGAVGMSRMIFDEPDDSEHEGSASADDDEPPYQERSSSFSGW